MTPEELANRLVKVHKTEGGPRELAWRVAIAGQHGGWDARESSALERADLWRRSLALAIWEAIRRHGPLWLPTTAEQRQSLEPASLEEMRTLAADVAGTGPTAQRREAAWRLAHLARDLLSCLDELRARLELAEQALADIMQEGRPAFTAGWDAAKERAAGVLDEMVRDLEAEHESEDVLGWMRRQAAEVRALEPGGG